MSKRDFVLNGMCCTFSLHAHRQTFLVAAVLAAVPLALIDDTVLVVATGVGEVFAHRPFEEALAALAAVDPVVFTCRDTRWDVSAASHSDKINNHNNNNNNKRILEL